mmetsp:Transcript_3059/g.8625  ORF Transcript_3059/g.8625 Transcript_3059/m.8625 type:complete len:93 (-) Transcript_3059:278-556(-)
MEGLGSYYGTFNQVQASGPYGKFGKWQNMKTTDEFDKRTKDSAAKSTEPRNFYTSPSKSGHIGLLGCVCVPAPILHSLGIPSAYASMELPPS